VWQVAVARTADSQSTRHLNWGCAAFKGNIEAVKQHLAAGTDVNAQNLNGFYPLTSAASWGHNEIVSSNCLSLKGRM